MGVLIDSRQKKYRIPRKKLKQRAQLALDALGCPEGELSILIVDDDQIAALNKTYLNREGPTNVIAFPMKEGSFSHISPSLLGDVVISVETAAKEGAIAGISVEERMMELLVHGILHLFGYDHETQDLKDALRMEKKNREILELISK